MLIVLLTSLVLAAPSISADPPATAGLLAVPRAPEGPGTLRDVVWPALGAGGGNGWRIEHTNAPLDTLLRPASTDAGRVGVLWATEDAAGAVRLHRVLFASGTHLVDTLDMPEGAPADAIADAIRLRLAFVLSAPVTAGDSWRPAERVLPMPALESVPPELRGDLATRRTPPVPRRTARVPAPPPALPIVAQVPDETLGGSDDRPVELGVGGDGMVSTGGLDVGLAGRVSVPVGARWWLGLSGRLHPFHAARRDGRPIGITGYSAFLEVDRWLLTGSAARVSARVGLGVDGLSVVGAGARSDGQVPALAISVPARIPLFGPVAFEVDAGVVLGLGERRALHGDAVLVSRGAVQARVGALLSWAVR